MVPPDRSPSPDPWDDIIDDPVIESAAPLASEAPSAAQAAVSSSPVPATSSSLSPVLSSKPKASSAGAESSSQEGVNQSKQSLEIAPATGGRDVGQARDVDVSPSGLLSGKLASNGPADDPPPSSQPAESDDLSSAIDDLFDDDGPSATAASESPVSAPATAASFSQPSNPPAPATSPPVPLPASPPPPPVQSMPAQSSPPARQSDVLSTAASPSANPLDASLPPPPATAATDALFDTDDGADDWFGDDAAAFELPVADMEDVLEEPVVVSEASAGAAPALAEMSSVDEPVVPPVELEPEVALEVTASFSQASAPEEPRTLAESSEAPVVSDEPSSRGQEDEVLSSAQEDEAPIEDLFMAQETPEFLMTDKEVQVEEDHTVGGKGNASVAHALSLDEPIRAQPVETVADAAEALALSPAAPAPTPAAPSPAYDLPPAPSPPIAAEFALPPNPLAVALEDAALDRAARDAEDLFGEDAGSGFELDEPSAGLEAERSPLENGVVTPDPAEVPDSPINATVELSAQEIADDIFAPDDVEGASLFDDVPASTGQDAMSLFGDVGDSSWNEFEGVAPAPSTAPPLLRVNTLDSGTISESDARRTPLVEKDEASLFPAELQSPIRTVASPPPGSSTGNPYGKPKSSNPYATANPYASSTSSLPTFSTPAGPPSSFGSLAPLPPPNPYGASPISPNPYSLRAASPSPYGLPPSSSPYGSPAVAPTPVKPAPPPFERKTKQTYDAYDPPSMPAIPVRKPQAPSQSPGHWGLQNVSSYGPASPAISNVVSPPPPPPGPPPKRETSFAPPPSSFAPSPSSRPSYAPPPSHSPAVFAPPSRPPSASSFAPPPRPSSALSRPPSVPPPHVYATPPTQPKPFSPPPPAHAKPFSPPPPGPPPATRGQAPFLPPPGRPQMASSITSPPSIPRVASPLKREVLQEAPAPSSRPYEGEDEEEEGGAGRQDWGSDEVDDYGSRPMSNDEHWQHEASSNRVSLDLPSARSSMDAYSRPSLDSLMQSDIPNGRPRANSRSVTAPPAALPVAAPPPPVAPPPRPSSSASNASSYSRYAAPPSGLPLEGLYNQAQPPYGRSSAVSPPPRPPSASQGRGSRQPSAASSITPIAPPPRPPSTSSMYGPSSGNSISTHAQSFGGSPTISNAQLPQESSFASRAFTTPASVVGGPVASTYTPDVVLAVADDPLGRGGEKFKKKPVMSFGFGGKVVICFPSLGGGGGYGLGGFGAGGDDMDLGDGRTVKIRAIDDVIPESALKTSTTEFPGPLFLDPGAGRGTSGEKAKKAAALAYIDARAGETESGLGWLKGKGDEAKFRSEEGKAVLLRLVGVMIGHDGRLMGSAKVEEEVRAILLPHLVTSSQPVTSSLVTPSVAIIPQSGPTSGPSSLYSSSPPVSTSLRADAPYMMNGPVSPNLATSPLPKTADVDQIASLLFRGLKKEAVDFAIEHKLWSHAMVISSCLDKVTWAEVVKAFARTELGSSEDRKHRDALRLTYEMFGGGGSAPLARTAPPPNQAAGASTFVAADAAPIAAHSAEALANWREVAGMMISNRSLGDTEALISLGDSLAARGWICAAHCCYLLSAHPPPLEGLGSAVPPRVHLYGASSTPSGPLDIDAVEITELLEFALSLVPTLKGQEPYSGIAHLQAYKLLHAVALSEIGQTAVAQRYCDAIASSLKSCKVNSPYHTRAFLSQLKELSERLSGTAQMDKSGSWISRTVPKPSLDSFGTWFENRMTKFVAGDGDDQPSAPETAPSAPGVSTAALTVGPFSHYDAISPGPTSASFLGRAASSANLSNGYAAGGLDPATGPRRSGSALALRPGQGFTNLASNDRNESSYGAYSAEPSRTSFDRKDSSTSAFSLQDQGHSAAPSTASSSYGEVTPNHYNSIYDAPPAADDVPLWGSQAYDSETPRAEESADAPQWGQSYSAPGDDDPRMSYDPGNRDDEDHEGALKEDLARDWRAGSAADARDVRDDGGDGGDEDNDDLGLGNSKAKAKKQPEAKSEDQPESKDDAKDVKPAPSTGWLGRLWGGKKEPGPPVDAKAAPIKAKLGEQTSFYYDKDLKKWVNKKSGSETAAPAAPPPPPSRAQTASPSQAMRGSSTGPPIGLSRPPSSARLDGSFAPPPPHQRMSSAPNSPAPPPSPNPSSGPSPAAGARPPPPGSRPPSVPPPGGATGPARPPIVDPTADLLSRSSTPGSTASGRKKNLRSRYVDVFEPPQA